MRFTTAHFRKLTIVLGTIAIAACAPTRPPVVVPHPPPLIRTVQATIRGTTNPDAQLLIDTAERIECGFVTYPDGVKRASCPLSPSTPAPFGAHLIVTAPDRLAQTIDFVLTGEPNQNLDDVVLLPSRIDLPRLLRVGQFFRLSTGERFTVIAASEFNLLGRLAHGEDISAVLEQRATAGYNTLRVFTAYEVPLIGRLVPREHPDLYTVTIPKLAQLAARRNLRLELVGFTGPYGSFFANADQMVAHWTALIDAVRDDTNVTLELVNEYNHAANVGIPIERLQRPPPPIVASHGSATQDDLPLQPFWDYATYHAAAPRKVVHNGWFDVADPYDIPVVVNETARAPENDGSLVHWQDVGRGCAAMVAGCTFHSVHGKDSTLWTGYELTLAQAFASYARQVALEFQDGYYAHDESREGGPAPCPCERYYEKRLPDGRSLPVPVRP